MARPARRSAAVQPLPEQLRLHRVDAASPGARPFKPTTSTLCGNRLESYLMLLHSPLKADRRGSSDWISRRGCALEHSAHRRLVFVYFIELVVC